MNKTSIVLGIMFAFVISIFGGHAVHAVNPNSSPNSDDRVDVLINFHEQPGASELQQVRANGGDISYTYKNFPVVAATIPEQARNALDNNPNVRLIEKDYEAYAVGYSAEDELGNSWGIDRISAGDTIKDGHTGDRVKVAVIDSGVDYTHRDLAPNFDTDELGYDAFSGETDPMDGYGHGTHVAGSVGAVADDFGVVGASPDVQLMALRVLDDDGYGSHSTILGALDWLKEYNAENSDDPVRITNNSYGSGGSTDALQSAFEDLAAQDVINVAAAGNSGNRGGNNDTVIYPAKYDTVMAVSATDSDDQRPSWSSTGPDVELAAPGVSVLSTWNSDESYADPQPFSFSDEDGQGWYKEGSGTSMSSPHVAGAAAIALGINDNFSNEEVRTILQDTAEDIGLRDVQQGYGLVRADRVAKAAIESQPTPTGAIEGIVTDADGQELNEVEVRVLESGVATKTDADGFYRLENAPSGEQEVQASKHGYDDVTESVTVDENSTVTQDFTLDAKPTYSIEGTVVDGDENTLEGVTVLIEETNESATTTSDGRYQFDSVLEGEYTLTASKDGYDADMRTLKVDSDLYNKDFTLQEIDAGATVSVDSIDYEGRGGPNRDRHLEIALDLVDDQGSAVEDASVSITLTNDQGEKWTLNDTTDDDGTATFSLTNVPDGTYTATVEEIDAENLSWDGQTPDNSYTK